MYLEVEGQQGIGIKNKVYRLEKLCFSCCDSSIPLPILYLRKAKPPSALNIVNNRGKGSTKININQTLYNDRPRNRRRQLTVETPNSFAHGANIKFNTSKVRDMLPAISKVVEKNPVYFQIAQASKDVFISNLLSRSRNKTKKNLASIRRGERKRFIRYL